MLTRDTATTISALSNDPYVFYHPEINEYGVAWMSTLMTLEHAILVCSSKFLFAHPAPETKIEAYNKFCQLYHAGFFGDKNWDEWAMPSLGKPDALWKLYQYQLAKSSMDSDVAYTYVLGWLDLLTKKTV